jgi:hypothetical protein
MKFLTLFVLSAGLVILAPIAAMATCYHGCIDYDADIGDGIEFVNADETGCSACSGGETTTYTIKIYAGDCPPGFPAATTTFCSVDSEIPVGQGSSSYFYVESIGAGCSGTPNGCVRICDCP